MKGLFNYSYDYYQWEYLICVSENESKLKDKYNEIKDDEELATCEGRHKELASKEIQHYMIEEVEVL